MLPYNNSSAYHTVNMPPSNDEYNLYDIGKGAEPESPKPSPQSPPQSSSRPMSIFRQISSKSVEKLGHHLLQSMPSILSNQDGIASIGTSDMSTSDFTLDSVPSTECTTSNELAASLSRTGKLMLRSGEYEKAIQYFSQALPMQRELFGTRHETVGATLNNMGVAYKYMANEYGQEECEKSALSCFEEALNIFQECLGSNHQVTKKTVHNLWQLMQRIVERKAREGCYVSRDYRTLMSRAA